MKFGEVGRKEYTVCAADEIQDIVQNVNTDTEIEEIQELLEEIRFQVEEMKNGSRQNRTNSR